MNRRTFSFRGAIGALLAPVVVKQPFPTPPLPPTAMLGSMDVAAKSAGAGLVQRLVAPIMPTAFKEYLAWKHKQMESGNLQDRMRHITIPIHIDVLKLPLQAKQHMAIAYYDRLAQEREEKEASWLEQLGIITESKKRQDEDAMLKSMWHNKYHAYPFFTHAN